MKKISLISFLFLLILSACEKDEDRIYVRPGDKATPPSLNMEGLSNTAITEENYDLFSANLNWSKAGFGKDIIVEYFLQIDTTETYATSEIISIGKDVYAKALSNADLSSWSIKFGGLNEETNETKEIFLNLRIMAAIALENSNVTIPPDTIVSNAVSIGVIPYLKVPEFPASMYMIGAEFGGWDWSSSGIAEMTPVWQMPGHFWCIRYISAGQGFKWCAKKAWDGDFFSLGEDIGYTTSDGNAFVASNGMYMVYMDMTARKISVEPAKVYGMGDCFGGWDTGNYPFAISGREMKYTATGSGELRMYAESSISPTGGDWWKKEFIILNNKIEYRGNGDDQTRISVNAGQTVTLDFNAGTGKIE